jgi:toxin ParE1/3/4
VSDRLYLRPAAEEDIDAQAEYLRENASLRVALRFRDAVQASLELLAGLGSRFRVSNPRLQGLRFWPVRGFAEHIVFYRNTGEAIEIVRVLHGKRDLDPILEAE